MHTWNSLITLSCIVKVSRLLHPVRLGIVSQIPSQGNRSHDLTDYSLGGPLHRLQANQPQTYPIVSELSVSEHSSI